MALIAVDMTPVLPGGDNGGAKILAIELLLSFQEVAPGDQFLILTSSWNDKELSLLDGVNMSRLCILKHKASYAEPDFFKFPSKLERAGRIIYNFFRRRFHPVRFAKRPLRSRGVDLLFCPFTAPSYFEPGIPVVCVVNDLQHKKYPQFFNPIEVLNRDMFIKDVKQKSNAIICISEYVRQTVIKHLEPDPERVFVVPIGLQARLPSPEMPVPDKHLEQVGLADTSYMFYPANFWEHKNHRMLLTAYGMFLSKNRDCDIHLVFTGALDENQKQLKCDAMKMGLSEKIHFLGFVDREVFVSILGACKFLIFPSLYEGFGIPVLEAMSMGKPVLCSNVTSLPEVAGEAALYFDPRKPDDIFRCLQKVSCDPDLFRQLGHKGKTRSERFKLQEMTNRYLEIFKFIMNNHRSPGNWVTGIYPDGWTGGEVVLTVEDDEKVAALDIDIKAPTHIPHRRVELTLYNDARFIKKIMIKRGDEKTIRMPFDQKFGIVTLSISPLFCPAKHNMGTDNRNLGVMCEDCFVVLENGHKKPFIVGGF